MNKFFENITFDDQDKVVYKGVKLYIPRENFNDIMKGPSVWAKNEIITLIEQQYEISLRYQRERKLRDLGL